VNSPSRLASVQTYPHSPAGKVYVASDIKPKRDRRTKAEVAAIRRAIENILCESKPQTVRQVFYALTVNLTFSARTAQLYMQLAKLDPNAQRVADLPLRRTVLELQRRDRDAKAAAQREEAARRWAEGRKGPETVSAALGAVVEQLNKRKTGPRCRRTY